MGKISACDHPVLNLMVRVRFKIMVRFNVVLWLELYLGLGCGSISIQWRVTGGNLSFVEQDVAPW